MQAYVIFDINSEKMRRFKFGCKNFMNLPKYEIRKMFFFLENFISKHQIKKKIYKEKWIMILIKNKMDVILDSY